MQHTFFCTYLCRCFVRLQRETSSTFQELPRFSFYEGNVIRFLVHFRFILHCRSFSPWWPLVFLIFSQLLKNFHVVQDSNKQCLLYITNILVSLFVFLFVCFFLGGGEGKFVKSSRRRNNRLPRVLAGKFLVFWLGGGRLREFVARDECVTVYLLKKVFSKSYVEDIKKQEMAVVNLQHSWRSKQ